QPSARHDPSVVYDPSRRRMVMFGGFDGIYQNDTWALDLSGVPAWSKLTTVGSPPGRYRHAAMYDPIRDRMIVIGGVSSAVLSDVWELRFGPTQTWNR